MIVDRRFERVSVPRPSRSREELTYEKVRSNA